MLVCESPTTTCHSSGTGNFVLLYLSLHLHKHSSLVNAVGLHLACHKVYDLRSCGSFDKCCVHVVPDGALDALINLLISCFSPGLLHTL